MIALNCGDMGCKKCISKHIYNCCENANWQILYKNIRCFLGSDCGMARKGQKNSDLKDEEYVVNHKMLVDLVGPEQAGLIADFNNKNMLER